MALVPENTKHQLQEKGLTLPLLTVYFKIPQIFRGQSVTKL